jgi:osomolarity two-component system sensor histidine kinase NIK1
MSFTITFLIIEDNLLNQKIISFWLAKNGYEFTFASSGEEALEVFKNRWFDVVIMDIMLPGMNGLETTSILRKVCSLQYGRQPIIFALTANTLDNDRMRCLQSGMDEYMAKPFDFQQLNDILEEHFSSK